MYETETNPTVTTPAVEEPPSKPVRRTPPKQRGRRYATEIAVRAAQGQTQTGIAADLGIDRSTVRRQLQHGNAWHILMDLVATYPEWVHDGFLKATAAIERAFEAQRSVLVKTGKNDPGTLVECGPDHRAQLAAVRQYLELITAGRPTPKPPASPNQRPLTAQEMVDKMNQALAERTDLTPEERVRLGLPPMPVPPGRPWSLGSVPDVAAAERVERD
jgi:hypothetical protein